MVAVVLWLSTLLQFLSSKLASLEEDLAQERQHRQQLEKDLEALKAAREAHTEGMLWYHNIARTSNAASQWGGVCKAGSTGRQYS